MLHSSSISYITIARGSDRTTRGRRIGLRQTSLAIALLALVVLGTVLVPLVPAMLSKRYVAAATAAFFLVTALSVSFLDQGLLTSCNSVTDSRGPGLIVAGTAARSSSHEGRAARALTVSQALVVRALLLVTARTMRCL
jgi:hypothetical protein